MENTIRMARNSGVFTFKKFEKYFFLPFLESFPLIIQKLRHVIMLELYVFQKLFERNLVKYFSKFNICYFLPAAATSKALIRRKSNRENRKFHSNQFAAYF